MQVLMVVLLIGKEVNEEWQQKCSNKSWNMVGVMVYLHVTAKPYALLGRALGVCMEHGCVTLISGLVRWWIIVNVMLGDAAYWKEVDQWGCSIEGSISFPFLLISASCYHTLSNSSLPAVQLES